MAERHFCGAKAEDGGCVKADGSDCTADIENEEFEKAIRSECDGKCGDEECAAYQDANGIKEK